MVELEIDEGVLTVLRLSLPWRVGLLSSDLADHDGPGVADIERYYLAVVDSNGDYRGPAELGVDVSLQQFLVRLLKSVVYDGLELFDGGGIAEFFQGDVKTFSSFNRVSTKKVALDEGRHHVPVHSVAVAHSEELYAEGQFDIDHRHVLVGL